MSWSPPKRHTKKMAKLKMLRDMSGELKRVCICETNHFCWLWHFFTCCIVHHRFFDLVSMLWGLQGNKHTNKSTGERTQTLTYNHTSIHPNITDTTQTQQSQRSLANKQSGTWTDGQNARQLDPWWRCGLRFYLFFLVSKRAPKIRFILKFFVWWFSSKRQN